jgi:signal transduction histidine kinase
MQSVEAGPDQPEVLRRAAGIPLRQLAERWRWYHFYFLLALFDLAVILASIGLYYQSLRTYQLALAALTAVGAKQSWVTDLRVAVVELNAPGNDIFETRELEAERRRFGDLRGRVRRLLDGKPLADSALHDFERRLAAMVRAEEELFSIFAALLSTPHTAEDEQALFDRASARMAAMDRAQASALTALIDVERSLRTEQQTLLERYERDLERNVAAERYFFATVAVALLGMFFFGRTLQRANDRMMADRRRVEDERRAHLMAIGEVCATVAHGLSNPLAGICAAAQLARERVGAGPLSEMLDDIISESRRLDERARRLLDFSRPLHPRLVPCDVRELLQGVVLSLQRSHKSTSFMVENSSLQINADADMLSEALYELGVNGIRAMDGQGALRFEATRNGARASIRVIDHGRGIPAAVRPRLFELFFTTRHDGTGMGLATVRKLIQVQGGTVRLESTQAGRTVFLVELPVAR